MSHLGHRSDTRLTPTCITPSSTVFLSQTKLNKTSNWRKIAKVKDYFSTRELRV